MPYDRMAMTVRVRWRTKMAFASAFGVLAIVTAWNLTRSAALVEAEHAYARGDLAGCVGRALDHLQRQPWSRAAALLAGRSLSRLDYAEAAEAYYERSGVLSLNDLQIRAYGLVRGPHPERAIPVFNAILERSPQNVTALRRMAALYLARNDTDELLKLAERLSKIPSGAIIGATLRAVVHHNQKNRQEAVAAFERVLELDPQLHEMPLPHFLFWGQFADDLMGSGRIDDARRYLKHALETVNNAEFMNKLGHTYSLQGELDDAERCFNQAAEWDPSYYAPHANLAKLALQRRQHDVALRELDKARTLAPWQHSVLYNLASAYRQLGRVDEANRIAALIQQLRERPASSARGPNTPWPRYAL
jgi:tetratricopeptide (TPR) repeat protein